MNIYWFSFSYNGKNNGVCLVKADCINSALDKTTNLGIQPKWDDIEGYELDSLEFEENLDFNRLYSSEEMIELGYNTVEKYE